MWLSSNSKHTRSSVGRRQRLLARIGSGPRSPRHGRRAASPPPKEHRRCATAGFRATGQHRRVLTSNMGVLTRVLLHGTAHLLGFQTNSKPSACFPSTTVISMYSSSIRWAGVRGTVLFATQITYGQTGTDRRAQSSGTPARPNTNLTLRWPHILGTTRRVRTLQNVGDANRAVR